jgi:hypothetical protein
LVVPQYSVQLGSKPLNRPPARVIEKVSAKLHADAIQRFKSMCEQKQLALCVERGALDAFAIPCAADLHTPVRLFNIPIACHPNNFSRAGISHCKGKHSTFRLAFQPPFDFSFHVGRSGMTVYQSFHNSPSCTASKRSSWWASDSGSRIACVPRKVMGSGQGMVIYFHTEKVFEVASVEFVPNPNPALLKIKYYLQKAFH